MTDAVALKLSPPWLTYVHKIGALFEGDILLQLDYDPDTFTLNIRSLVDDGDKIAALLKLLPAKKSFGKITVKINIEGAPTDRAFTSNKELFEVAFNGNPAFAYCECAQQSGSYYYGATYVVFKNHVVQFFCDDLRDPRGLVSTLYQDIAAEIFADADVLQSSAVDYCTDIVGKVYLPLGK